MDLNMRITMNSINSESLQHNRLPDIVLGRLMDWIMDGKLQMGDKLVTEDIARQLGVSRMPIREALNNIEKIGLAETMPYAGTKLISLTKEDVVQIYVIRKALEPVAAYYACINITDDEIRHLEEVHKEFIRIISKDEVDAKELYQINRYFHFVFYSVSKLNRLCSIIEGLWDTLSFFKLIYGHKCISSSEKVEVSIKEHQSYIDALKEKDADKIFTLLSENLNRHIKDIPYESTAYFSNKN